MTFKPDLSSVVTSLIGILALGACGGVSPAPRTDGGGGRSGADGGRVTDAVLNPSDAGGLGGASGQGGMGAGGGQGGASGDGGQEVGSGQGGADAGGGQGGAVVADGSVDVQAQSSPDVAPDSVSGAPDLGVDMEAGTTLDVAPLPPADAATSQDLPMESSAAASPLMIEDFEDCDGQIITQEGRRGTWYSYLDDYGIGSTLTPDLQKVAFVAASGGKPGSERCSGQWVGVTKVGMVDGQTKYGYAGVGFAFNDGANYDASAYGGIGLWLKGSGKVTLTLRNATAEYGADTITLAGDWTYAVLPWSSFRRTVKVGNDDVVEVVDPLTLRNLQVNFPSDDVFTSVIDDIAFLPLPSTPDGGTDAAPAPSDGSAAGDADAGTDVAAGLSLIDDVEDCDLTIPMRDGRAGNWSANKDSLDLVTRLTTSAVAGGTPASPTCSLQSTGMIGPDQWAHLDLSLNNGGDYDASSYLGLSFWAKGHGTINIEVATSGTIPTGSGGTCASPSGGADIHCDWWNHYQKSITLADTWQNFQIRWDDVNFTRPVGPVAGGFDPHKIRWVQWDFGGGDAVDMTLDDVAFLKASP